MKSPNTSKVASRLTTLACITIVLLILNFLLLAYAADRREKNHAMVRDTHGEIKQSLSEIKTQLKATKTSLDIIEKNTRKPK